LSTPRTLSAGGMEFEHKGSVLARRGAPWQGPLKIGVLGAIKDAGPETRSNVRQAAAQFARAGVHVVVANGDIVGDETSALVPVVQMLREELRVPVFAHAGNYEWTTAFTEAFAADEERFPHVFNMNLIWHVDLGGVHLLSLPGYHDRRFAQPGSCHYDADDVAALTSYARALTAAGDVVVLTAHGPPRGAGKGALDVTFDGDNVGDPQINRLLQEADIRVGVFSHILEAGGRAAADAAGAAPLALPMKKGAPRLVVNVGSASSFPWRLLDGSSSTGMAAIVTVEKSDARVEVVRLTGR
jgi:Icc-related predicted phosphoesterase